MIIVNASLCKQEIGNEFFGYLPSAGRIDFMETLH